MDVLLAEDNLGDVRLVERAIRRIDAGIQVHSVDDGVKALSFLRRERDFEQAPRPAFVLLDLKLPRKSGLEVLAELKREPALRNIPVVVLSSSKAEHDIARAYDLQATAYVAKPTTDYDRVMQAIIRLMQVVERPLPVREGALSQADRDKLFADTAGVPLPMRVPGDATGPQDVKFRLAVEALPHAMVMVDAGGTIILVNAETERMFGYPRSELLGQSIETLVPRRFRAQHEQHRTDFLAAPVRRAMGAGRDLSAVRRDGSEFPVEIGLNPIDTREGRLVLGSIVDITARKHAEQLLEERTRELSRSNAELEQFAYVASHDLQEPLRMIGSYSRLLEAEITGHLDAESEQYFQFIKEGTERMQQLLHDLLAYSRVGSRARPSQRVACEDVLAATLSNLRLVIEENQANVQCAALPEVMGDRTQMGELFQNLIANAIKFRGADAPQISITARPEGSMIVFAVRDNGIGIEAEHWDSIFELFSRLHSRDRYPGTGIGLAICKRIVERLGGRIWVESVLGRGSTFYFSLPAVR